MKKRSLLKTTILLLGVGLAALTGFSSCENFMKGGQVRDEIVDVIAYNNAPSCTVSFSDEGMGSFLVNKKETFKVGYASQVQFEVTKEKYHFVGFKAVINDSDKTPLKDYVKFESADNDERNAAKGIYKYNVTILKERKDILIIPDCKELPKITQITPAFESNGCEQDFPIEIKFNKAIDIEATPFDPACISIFADEDLAQYFNTAKLTSDNKTVYISPKELLLKPNETRNYLTIEVDYDFTNLVDEDKLPLTEKGTHTYKINKNFREQKFVKVQPETDDAYGKFLSTEEKQCTVGYTVDIQFTLKKQDYKFVKFVPVITNGTTETPADCVIFENEEYDNESGIYKASVKVTKALNDNEKIIIRPECMLIPKITSVYPPKDNTSYPQDTSIKIYFNKAIKLSDFADQNGFLKNIIITTGSQDLLDTQDGKTPYYKSPYLEDEGKTLVIPIVSGNYLISDTQTKDIQVTVLLEELKDAVEGENLLFNQDEYSFAFKLNGEKDSTPPVLKTLNIARTQQDAMNGTNLISVEEFTHYAAKANYNDDSTKVAANIQNHHVNKVWVYFEAEDEQSGAAYLEVKEQLIRDTSAVEKVGLVFDKTTNESNCIKNESTSKNFSGSFEYDFKSNEDGVARLDFYLFDYAGKSVTKTVDLIKDTELNLNVYLYDLNPKYIFEVQNPHNVPYHIELKQKIDNQNLYIKDIDENSYYDTFLTSNENDFLSTVKILSFEYGYSTTNMNIIDLSDQTYQVVNEGTQNNPKYREQIFVDINVDPYKDVYTKIKIQDLAGNITELSDVIPKIIEISSVRIHEENSKLYWSFVLNSAPAKMVAFDGFCIKEASDNKTSIKEAINRNFYLSTTKTVSDHYSYYYQQWNAAGAYNLSNLPNGVYSVAPLYYDNGFYSYSGNYISITKTSSGWTVNVTNCVDLQSSDIPTQEQWSVLEDPYIKNLGTRTVHVNFDRSFIHNSQLDYFVYSESNSKNDYFPIADFSKPVNITVPTTYSNYDFKIVAYNKKGDCLQTDSKTIDLSYDNIAPYISSAYPSKVTSGKREINIQIKEDGIGIDEAHTIKYYLSNQDHLENSIDWEKQSFVPISVASIYAHTFEIVYYEKKCPQYLYIYTQDRNGNFSIKRFYHITENLEKYPRIFIENSYFYVDCDQLSYGYYDNGFSFINNNNWSPITDIIFNNNNNIPNQFYFSLTNTEKLSFLRIQLCRRSGSSNRYGCTYPLYVYPQYLLSRDTDNPIVCDLKDFYIGKAGINILADQPCFAHTLYCPRDLGDTAEAWLNGGLETGLVMKQKSFTYSYDNTAGVPDGYYYTTIIHFADGTVLMSPVMQK